MDKLNSFIKKENQPLTSRVKSDTILKLSPSGGF